MTWYTVKTARPSLSPSEIAFFLLAVCIILFAGAMIGIGLVVG